MAWNRPRRQRTLATLALAGLALTAAPAAADVVVSQTILFGNKDLGGIHIRHIALHVDTLSPDAVTGKKLKHLYVTCELQAIDPASEEIVYDLLFRVQDAKGALIDNVFANYQALFRQQAAVCGTDNGDRVDAALVPTALEIQLTTSLVRHFDPEPLTPLP